MERSLRGLAGLACHVAHGEYQDPDHQNAEDAGPDDLRSAVVPGRVRRRVLLVDVHVGVPAGHGH